MSSQADIESLKEKARVGDHIEYVGVPELKSEPKQEDAIAHASQLNLTYAIDDVEPDLHFRTYLAVFALFFLNFVQVFALTGPPVVVRL